MKKSLIFTFVALFATLGTVSAQQNYALLIAGNMKPDSQVIPLAEQWNGGIGAHPQHGFDEFWNDIYLQWEMLVIHKSYDNDNVMVLFGENGSDFTFAQQDVRYKASYYPEYSNITDDNSKIGTITSTFAGLANTITDDDFLYIWIMSHGGTDGNGSYFYSYDNQKVYASELAALIGGIPAHKKVVVLSFPKSGGFLPVLEADDTIIITAGGATQGASVDEGFGREKREER
jgi:RNA binding exosome subunit